MAGPMDRHEHVVQLYGTDERLLARNVCRYLAEGFARGDALLLVATPRHTDLFASGLAERGLDVPRIVREGRLTVMDTGELLGRIMLDGMPDPRLFDDVVSRELRTVRRRAGSANVCAYGEMVGVLWSVGEFAAAERLEALWNAAMAQGGLRLYCAYAIDVLGQGWDSAAVTPILAAHSAVVSGGDDLRSALERAMDDVLGDEAGSLRGRLESGGRDEIAPGEWLATRLVASGHARASEILDRARFYQQFRPQPA